MLPSRSDVKSFSESSVLVNMPRNNGHRELMPEFIVSRGKFVDSEMLLMSSLLIKLSQSPVTNDAKIDSGPFVIIFVISSCLSPGMKLEASDSLMLDEVNIDSILSVLLSKKILIISIFLCSGYFDFCEG